MTVNNQQIDPKEYNDSPPKESTLADEITRKMSQLQKVGRDISAFINGFQLNVDRDNGAVQINLRKKTRPLVELIPLLKYCEEINPLEAIIGWNKTQEPMLWSAKPNAKNHLLLSGAPHAGKTGLLRSLILTLVLATRPSQLQLAIIDGSCRGGNNYDHSGLKKFSTLPHLLNRPPANPEEVCEIVSFIAKEADHRLKHHITTPQILLVIDNLQDILPVAGPEFHQQLEHILDIGAQTGIRVILATNRPEDGRLQDLLAGMEVDRMIGKVQSAGQAAFASGRSDSDAECLDGNGEFLAELSGQNFHFQAAWVSEKHLNQYLQYLNEHKQPALLAWSIPADEDIYENLDETYGYGFLEKSESNQESEIEEATPGIENDCEEPAKDSLWNYKEEEEVELKLAPTDLDVNDAEDDDIEAIPIEYAANEPITDSDDSEVHDEIDFEEHHFESEVNDLEENEDLPEPNEDRLTQLASIYTKLTGFWSEEPIELEGSEEKVEDDQQTGELHDPYRFDTHENLDDDFEDEDDEEWEADESIEFHSDNHPEPNQPQLIFHEPEPEYTPRSNGWLEFAHDSIEGEEEVDAVDESTDTDIEPNIERFGDNQASQIDFEQDEPENEPFSFTAENIVKPGRRSRLSQAKPKHKTPDSKPIKASADPLNEPTRTNTLNNEPFDPWQNGLDEDPQSEENLEDTRPSAIVRPPRLVAKKPPTIRRKVSHASNHFNPKPKPKPKAIPSPEKATDENIDGEIE